MKTQQNNNFLFRLASRFLKYLLLFTVGLAIAFVMSTSFGASHFMMMLLPLIGQWLGRLALILLCLFAAAMIVESVVQK
ncbi:hypothetical protein [Nostoc sp. 106C]|uniref:hypothetical protein n=1 Tax=Nostoc sp. 106C TaxID=1932667 RepID=UPI000A3AF316|nr:hypothetical protein [Nostoc sp. 106C]OUL25261.1 hypothetical protein BV378_17065 [Nostoc sp. RF31YmG]OUL33615.1 hypothetical protein BV375_06865 [Nostoc sp. 106C]